jgi:hypothetical protein
VRPQVLGQLQVHVRDVHREPALEQVGEGQQERGRRAVEPVALAELGQLGRDVRRDGAFVRLRVDTEAALPEIARRLVTRGAGIYHLTATRPSLEAQFLDVMGEDQRPG